MKEKVYKVLLNGNLVFHTMSEGEIRSLFYRAATASSFWSMRRYTTAEGTWEIQEDSWLQWQCGYVEDGGGCSHHILISDEEGNVLLSEMGGDWTDSIPSAVGTPVIWRSRADLQRTNKNL